MVWKKAATSARVRFAGGASRCAFHRRRSGRIEPGVAGYGGVDQIGRVVADLVPEPRLRGGKTGYLDGLSTITDTAFSAKVLIASTTGSQIFSTIYGPSSLYKPCQNHPTVGTFCGYSPSICRLTVGEGP